MPLLYQTDHRKVKNLFARRESADFSTKHPHCGAGLYRSLLGTRNWKKTSSTPAYDEMTGKNGRSSWLTAASPMRHVRELMIELQGIDLDGSSV